MANMGIGLRNLGIVPLRSMATGALGINPFDFDPGAVAFTAAMAKRAIGNVFETAPIVQGDYDGSGVPDALSFPRGALIDGSFYANFDGHQGSAVTFWTSEKDRDATQTNDEYLWYVSSDYWLRHEHDAQVLRFSAGGQESTQVHTSVAGTPYVVIVRWDCNNDLDGGGNYLCISVDDAHTFGAAVQPTASAPDATIYLGSNAGTTLPANAILEGTVWYRRILFDGVNGIDVGNGDEIALISAGADPALVVNGSWDTTDFFPTDQTAGALVTGADEMWSHPHSSNLLGTDEGFMFNVAAWNNWVMVATPINPALLAAAEKIFSGGYKFDTNAVNEGYARAYACAPGDDFVIRAITHCSAGTVRVELWDATGAASIGYIDGASNVRTAPNVHLFAGEAPAGCNSVQVRIYNLNNGPTTYCHQAELYVNLIDNPSLEGVYAGVPPIPPGWVNVNLEAGDTQASSTGGAVIHSGSDCIQFNVGASNEGIDQIGVAFPAGGLFYAIGGFGYTAGGTLQWGTKLADKVFDHATDVSLNSSGTAPVILTSGAAWHHAAKVGRADATWGVYIRAPSGATGARYADDVYVIALDPVTITATAANEANSTENGGIRVDGFDNGPQPIPAGRIFATEGWVRINVTPRHDIVDMDNFGELQPNFFRLWGNATNFIEVYISAGNTARLRFDDGGGIHTTPWVAAGALVADARYIFEVRWDAVHMELIVDGVQRVNIVQPVNFTLVPTQWWVGTDQTGEQQIDAVFSSP